MGHYQSAWRISGKLLHGPFFAMNPLLCRVEEDQAVARRRVCDVDTFIEGVTMKSQSNQARLAQMPRPRVVESHVRHYGDTPRDKLVVSERRQQRLVATSVTLHETSSWHLRTLSKCRLVRFSLAIAVALMFMATPALAQSARPDKMDEMIDVGGYRLHIVCEGQVVKGVPIVILDSGGGSSSSSWRLVQPEVAKFARVCSYDRPGLGRSERKPKPYTSLDVMKDLHTLLAKAGIGRPYVMAGHSLGGMNIRIFAKLYPKEVSGLVLVDSFSEDEHPRTIALIPPEALKKIPPEHLKPMIREDLDLEASIKQSLADNWRANIPLIVLTRAPLKNPREEMYPGGSEPFPGAAEKFEQLRIDLQNDLARRSTNSKHVIAEKSGHNIQLDQPELIVESIRRVIAATGNKDKNLSQQ